jgi:hypothetical protein
MRKLFISSFLLFSILFCVSCVATNNNSDRDIVDIPIGELVDLTIATTKNYKSTRLPAGKLKAFFLAKFEDSSMFTDFEIISQNEENFYIIATGTREKKPTRFGVELEVTDNNLVLQDFNKLFFTCISHYCKTCDFKFDADGAISGCNCAELTETPPKGFAACEHTLAIKTLEKD